MRFGRFGSRDGRRVGRRVGREESVYLVISLLFAVEVMLLLLLYRVLFVKILLLSPEIMSVIKVYIFWTLFNHPSGVGADDGELEELKKI